MLLGVGVNDGRGAEAGHQVTQAEPRHLEEDGQELAYWLGPQTQAILEPMLADGYLFTPTYRRKRCNLVHRWTKETYCRTVQAACRKAGLTMWTPRQLRKARATELQLLDGINEASADLGHTTIDTTARHYASRSELARKIQARRG